MPPVDPKGNPQPANVRDPYYFSIWDHEAEVIDPKNLADCYCENAWRTHDGQCQPFMKELPDGTKVRRDLPVAADKVNRMLCNQFTGDTRVQVEWVKDKLYFVRRWKGQIGPRPALVIAEFDAKNLPMRSRNFLLFPTDSKNVTVASRDGFDWLEPSEEKDVSENHLRYIIVPTDLREDVVNTESAVRAYFDSVLLTLKEGKPYIDEHKLKQVKDEYETGVYTLNLKLRDGEPQGPKKGRRIVQLIFLIDKSYAGKLAIECAEKGECEERWKEHITTLVYMARASSKIDEVRAGVMSYRFEDSTVIEQPLITVYKDGAYIAGAKKMIFDAVTGGKFSGGGYPYWPGYIGSAIQAAVGCFNKDEYDSASGRGIYIISPRLPGLLGLSYNYPYDTFDEASKYANENGVGVSAMWPPIPMPEFTPPPDPNYAPASGEFRSEDSSFKVLTDPPSTSTYGQPDTGATPLGDSTFHELTQPRPTYGQPSDGAISFKDSALDELQQRRSTPTDERPVMQPTNLSDILDNQGKPPPRPVSPYPEGMPDFLSEQDEDPPPRPTSTYGKPTEVTAHPELKKAKVATPGAIRKKVREKLDVAPVKEPPRVKDNSGRLLDDIAQQEATLEKLKQEEAPKIPEDEDVEEVAPEILKKTREDKTESIWKFPSGKTFVSYGTAQRAVRKNNCRLPSQKEVSEVVKSAPTRRRFWLNGGDCYYPGRGKTLKGPEYNTCRVICTKPED